MIDRENVIKGLECCIESDDEACPKECPFYKECLTDDMPYMPVIRAALELLKEQEGLEKKYIALLNEKISELIEENAKLNLKMNQAISERSIHTVDRM